jgi:hypothetical protein
MRAWLRERYSDPAIRERVLDDIERDRTARGFYFREAHPPASPAVEAVDDRVAVAAGALSDAAALVLALFTARASGGAPAAGVAELTPD